MDERDLFAGYRVAAGYAAQCVCGAWITAPSSADPLEIGQRVLAHNESSEHVQFIREQEAVDLLRGHPHVHCSCYGVRA